jgi:hypothetical protein
MIATVIAAALFARFTVLAPKEGMQTDFDAGYKRHLEWHAAQPDTWTWLGWTITTGERFGTFIDATVDREARDFDTPVAPAADAADNAKNVLPFARIVSTAVYRQRRDLGSRATADLKSRLLTMMTIDVQPGAEPRFEAQLRSDKGNIIVFELVNGGDVPRYLVFVPAQKMSEVAEAATVPVVREGIRRMTVETVRFRADLSYEPASK